MDRTIPALALARWTVPGPAPRRGLPSRLVTLVALRRSRLSLAALDEHLLHDVGLSRAEALREARRPAWEGAGSRPWKAKDAPAWNAPARWLR